MRSLNQIHDVGKLIREAVAQGWEIDFHDHELIAFARGEQFFVMGSIARSWAELTEARRALGLPATSEALHG